MASAYPKGMAYRLMGAATASVRSLLTEQRRGNAAAKRISDEIEGVYRAPVGSTSKAKSQDEKQVLTQHSVQALKDARERMTYDDKHIWAMSNAVKEDTDSPVFGIDPRRLPKRQA